MRTKKKLQKQIDQTKIVIETHESCIRQLAKALPDSKKEEKGMIDGLIEGGQERLFGLWD